MSSIAALRVGDRVRYVVTDVRTRMETVTDGTVLRLTAPSTPGAEGVAGFWQVDIADDGGRATRVWAPAEVEFEVRPEVAS